MQRVPAMALRPKGAILLDSNAQVGMNPGCLHKFWGVVRLTGRAQPRLGVGRVDGVDEWGVGRPSARELY